MTTNNTNQTAVREVRIDTNLQEEDEIDLVELFYLMIDNIEKIVLCLVICAILAFAGTRFLITPKYQATSKMYIVSASQNSVVNLSDLNISPLKMKIDHPAVTCPRISPSPRGSR